MTKKNWSLEGIDPPPVRKKTSTGGMDPAVESSAHMRQQLAEEGRPVLVAFSRGKDSICAMIALMAAGVEVIPVHLYRVPGLQFEEESLKEFEEFFGMKIYNLPHRDFTYYLEEGVHAAPWQNGVYDALGISRVPFPVFWDEVRYALDLPEDTWVCDGIRAADSPMRRLSIVTHSPWTSKVDKIDDYEYLTSIAHVVWDWKIKDIRRCLAQNDVKLPVDYDLFGRTFDGLDYRFIKPVKEHFPEDYQTIVDWFPGVELEIMRYEYL